MSLRKENIKVEDQMGFVYEVELQHYPHFGFTNAIYMGEIIAQREYGRITEPIGDDDREWEMYEELFGEWSDTCKCDIEFDCKIYFNAEKN